MLFRDWSVTGVKARAVLVWDWVRIWAWQRFGVEVGINTVMAGEDSVGRLV